MNSLKTFVLTAAATVATPGCGALLGTKLPDQNNELTRIIQEGRAQATTLGFMRAATEKGLKVTLPKKADPREALNLGKGKFGACVFMPGVKNLTDLDAPLNPKDRDLLNKARDVARVEAAAHGCHNEGLFAAGSKAQDEETRRGSSRVYQASSLTAVSNVSLDSKVVAGCENMAARVESTTWVFADLSREFPVAAVCSTAKMAELVNDCDYETSAHETESGERVVNVDRTCKMRVEGKDSAQVYMLDIATGKRTRVADQAVLKVATSGASETFEKDENGNRVQRLDFGGGEELQKEQFTPEMRIVNPNEPLKLMMSDVDGVSFDEWSKMSPHRKIADQGGCFSDPTKFERGYTVADVEAVRQSLLDHRLLGQMTCLSLAGDYAGTHFIEGTLNEQQQDSVETCFTDVDTVIVKLAGECDSRLDSINDRRNLGFGTSHYRADMPKLPLLHIR